MVMMRSAVVQRLILLGALLAALPGAPARAQTGDLTLTEIYTQARANNSMLKAVAARANAVEAMESSARLPPDPQIQVGVMNASLPGLETSMPTSMAPAIQAMQMLPFPGKLKLSGRIAEQSTAIARAEANEQWWMVRSQAAMAFYEIYGADRQVSVMRETAALLEDFEQVARAMYGAGEGRQTDVLRASVEVARMEADIARMQAMRTAAVARLNAVLNRQADAPVPGVALPPLPARIPSADTLQRWAEAERPRLERSRLGVEQAESRLGLARRELWPDVSVGLQYGQRQAGEMGTERMGSLMLGFNVPIFARSRQLKMREEATAMQQMAQAELVDARSQVNARIGELLAELDRARTLVRLYGAEVLPQAEANVTSSYASYRVGAVDFMTLVDAQMTVNQYRQELFALLADYGQLVAELEMAVGRELPSTSEILTGES
jgi:outer membrane protein TolC